MNEEQIFCKTREGELALTQRTRLVQRNLRNVLILVDGVTSVRALTGKLGDPNFVRASLSELERGGYIETIEEQAVRRGPDSVLDGLTSDNGPPTIPVPLPTTMAPPKLPPQVETVLPEHSRFLEEHTHPHIDYELDADDEDDEDPLPEPEAPRIDHDAPPARSWRERLFGRFARKPRAAEAPLRQEPALTETYVPAEPERAAAIPAYVPPKPIKVRIKPVRRGPQEKTSWGARALLGLVLLLGAGAVALVMFPYDRYRGEAETRLSAWAGQPVAVGEMRLALTPRPGIVLDQVRVGGEGGLVLGSLRVVPDPFSLRDPTWRIQSATLDRLLIDRKVVAALFQARGAANGDALVMHVVKLENASVSLPGVALDNVSGTLEYTRDGQLVKFELSGADGALKLKGEPAEGGAYALALNSAGWRAPFGAGVQVNSIDAQGTLTRDALRVSKFDLRVFDGSAKGSLNLAWNGQVNGALDMELSHMNGAKLLGFFEPAAKVAGELDGKFAFKSEAAAFDGLRAALRGGGSFTLDKAVVAQFDLVEAVRTHDDAPIRGGETRFDALSGNLALEAGGWRLTGLKGSSGAMHAAGTLHRAGDKLDGAVDVAVSGSANQVRVPVGVSGSLADPLLTARRRPLPAPAPQPEGTLPSALEVPKG